MAKVGMELIDLLKEVKRQTGAKRDFIADSRALSYINQIDRTGTPGVGLKIKDGPLLGVTPTAHSQIAEFTKIPKAYYDRMLNEAPDLLADNVDRWFQKYPAPRMVRVLDDKCRAFLSNGYRPLDNWDLLEAALQPLLDLGLKVVSCNVSDNHLYLKVVDAGIERQLPTGVKLGEGHSRMDVVSPAMVLSNSEVGYGAMAVQTAVWTGGCTNLMVIQERSTRKYHIGSKMDLGEEIYKLLSDQTRRLTDAALWSQIGDVAKAAFDIARFDATVEKLAATAEQRIEGNVIQVMEVTAQKFGFNEGERKSVLENLIRSGDFTRYGLHAAVTRSAEDIMDYDRASEFERIGGKIIELPKTEWEVLSKAA